MATETDCLKDFIVIKSDSVTSSPSGLFINVDLPITLDMMQKIKEADQADLAAMWSEIQDRALKKFAIRVKLGYRELFGMFRLPDDWFETNKDNLAVPLLYYLGSELMVERIFSTRINRYTTIDVKKAQDLKALFDQEFPVQLKAALEIINVDLRQESGEVFTFREILP